MLHASSSRTSFGWAVPVVLIAAGLGSMRQAKADPREKLVGLGAGLCAPGFEPQNRASPALLSWGLQVFAYYGPDFGPWSWDLSFGASLSWATYSGVSPDYTYQRVGETMHGDLYFEGALYHPEALVQYELFSGWDIASYIEAGVGALWTTFRDAKVNSPASVDAMSSSVGDFGHGGLTVSLASKVDWRIARSLKVGASVKYSRTNSALLKRTVSVPVTISYYWW